MKFFLSSSFSLSTYNQNVGDSQEHFGTAVQEIRVGQRESIDRFGDDSRRNGGNNKQEDELESKVSQSRNLVASKRQKIQKEQVWQETGLEEDTGQVLSLIRKGLEGGWQVLQNTVTHSCDAFHRLRYIREECGRIGHQVQGRRRC